MNINELLTINAAYLTGACTVVVGLAIGAIGTARLYSGRLPTGKASPQQAALREAERRREDELEKASIWANQINAAGLGELTQPTKTGVL